MTYLANFLLVLALHNPNIQQLDRAQLFCQATAVYHEARGEPVMGQVAVAYVVKNRMQDPAYANDACSVVYDPGQFSDIRSAKPDYSSQAWAYAVEAAAFTQMGYVEDPTGGALWYYNPKKAKWRWWNGVKVGVKIGDHVFLVRK